MATTHRSDLIDELEKAIRDEAYDGGFGALPPERFTDYVRTLAETAARVVEEVHTPTDDDRTSEEQEEQRHSDRDADHEEQQTDDRAATGRLGVAGSHAKSMAQAPSDGKRAIAAGYRHSEVPEPQGEPSDAVANAVARAIIDHDEDRLTCYDHPEDFCCPCGTHGMARSEWQRHRARAALRAAGGEAR